MSNLSKRCVLAQIHSVFLELMLELIVNHAPDNHITTFLACPRVQQYCDAWPVREVRLVPAQLIKLVSLASLLIVYTDFRRNMPRNFRPSNQTKSFAGFLISAQSTWKFNLRIERSQPTWRHWKLLSLSCSRRKVKHSSSLPCLS